MTGARALIVGLDGATWDLADRFMAEGRMPVLARLVAEGARAPLNSTTPPMTLPSWSSLLTGCNPGRHGIFDFVHGSGDGWGLEFTNATHRAVPTIHELLSERGGRVASIAVPTTWPPSPVNGVVVSGFDSPVSTGIDGSFCHPPELHAQLHARFGGLRFADFQETHIGPGWHDSALDALLREIPRKQAIGEWLLDQERWDCFMLLFGESDTVSHHFWLFHDDGSPRHPSAVPPHLRAAITSVYTRLDQALGRLIERASPDVVCVCSDHGFGGAGTRVLYLNRYLERAGWLRYARDVQVAGVRSGSGPLDRVREFALGAVPASVQGRLFRALPSQWLGKMESTSRFGDLDRKQTRAFSDEMNYAATLRLAHGTRGEAGRIDELRDLLLAWQVDGHRVVRGVHRREDLYEGPCVGRSPELIIELALRDGYSYTLLPSVRAAPGQTSRVLSPGEFLGGKGLGMNGSHRQHGVLCLWGKGVRAGAHVQAGMADVAPTLLHLLGEVVPAHMDGRVIEAAVLHAPDPRGDGTAARTAGPIPTRDVDAAAIRERLERLGYL